MKALKIASLTALAAAISAQAAADFYITKGADITVSGALTTSATFNLEDGEVAMVKNLNDDGQTKATLALDNGVFSANLTAELLDDDKSVKLGDVVVKDGNLSFGQVGSVVNTQAYTAEQDNDTADALDYGVDAAIRVTDVVPGLNIQLEGTDTDYGLGAGFSQDVADGITAHASLQYRVQTTEKEAADPYFGAGVTAAVAGATVKANVQSGAELDWGVQADYAAAGLTVGASAGQYGDADLAYRAHAGYAYDADGVAASAKATYFSSETIEVDVDASFTQDAVKYFAGTLVTIPAEGDADIDSEVGATYTRVATYTAKFVANDAGEDNAVVVEASYSF